MKAMVLAAGNGTRLFPLTGVLPKPMAPVAGKPVLQHIFDLVARAGVEEIHVTYTTWLTPSSGSTGRRLR